MKPPYFLLEDGHPTGPHSLLVLHQKADIRVITPESAVRPLGSPDAPWLPIHALPDLHQLLFPPKTAPTLGAARFSATNPPIGAATAQHAVDVDHILQDNAARLAASERFNPGAISSRRARRHRSYLLTVLAFAAPAWASYHYGLLPRTEMTLVLLASFVSLVALLSYWIIYHITDFRS
jgi:hypothetical protein